MMGDQNLVEQVFGNAIVIDQIAKFSDFSSLKSLRQINKQLKDFLSPILLKKSEIILKRGEHWKESLEFLAQPTPFLMEIKQLQIEAYETMAGKMQEEEETELYNDILKKFALTLENLSLNPNNLFEKKTGYFFPSQDIQFPNVSKLLIGNYNLDLLDLYPTLFHNFPNLQELKVSNIFENNFILSSLIDKENGSRDLSLVPKLNSLAIFNHFNSWDVRSLEELLKFPQNWKKFDLALPIGNDVATAKLEELLEQNSASLLRLRLREFPLPISFLEGRLRHELLFLNCFPNLEKLEFVSIGQLFSLGWINYSEIFPNLKTLCFRWENYRSQQTVLDMPNIFCSKQICRSVQNLIFSVPRGPTQEIYINAFRDSINFHKQMFPNARILISNSKKLISID